MAEPTTPVMVRMTGLQLKALDAYRREQPDLPGRPEAIRRLVEQALATQSRKGRK